MLNNENIRELEALVSLLDEPNEDMFMQIRHKVLTYKGEAIPILEEAWTNNLGDNETNRIEELIEEIRVNKLFANLDEWVSRGSVSLFKGYMILMDYLKPDIDKEKYFGAFDRLVKEVWLEINDELTALEKVKVINHVVYMAHHYSNDDIIPPTPSDFFVDMLLDKHKGNSITLGILYISVCQSLGIPVFGVDLPGNFISVYMDDITTIRKAENYLGDDVLFYLNPAKNGNVFTHNEIKHYCEQMNIKLLPQYFLPAKNDVIILRMMKELENIFRVNDDDTKADGLAKVVSKLMK